MDGETPATGELARGAFVGTDHVTLEQLYEASAPGAYRLAYVLTGSREAAEDLVQDGFVRLCGRFRHLRDGGSFDAYLRRTIINLATSRVRHHLVERRYLASQRNDQLADDAPSVEDRTDLARLLQELPSRQRVALVLRFYEDFSEDETARLMRVSPRAVNSLVSRGLGRLRALRGDAE
jgi:RNA polymerase sigma factor (sigma-70 family)